MDSNYYSSQAIYYFRQKEDVYIELKKYLSMGHCFQEVECPEFSFKINNTIITSNRNDTIIKLYFDSVYTMYTCDNYFPNLMKATIKLKFEPYDPLPPYNYVPKISQIRNNLIIDTNYQHFEKVKWYFYDELIPYANQFRYAFKENGKYHAKLFIGNNWYSTDTLFVQYDQYSQNFLFDLSIINNNCVLEYSMDEKDNIELRVINLVGIVSDSFRLDPFDNKIIKELNLKDRGIYILLITSYNEVLFSYKFFYNPDN